VYKELENTIEEKIGMEQAPIDENQKLAVSDIQKQGDMEVSNEEFDEEDAEDEEQEESMDDIFKDLDMPTEQLVRLAQLRKEDVENSKEVLLDEPAIIKPDITKMKTIQREMDDGRIIDQEQYPVIQKHPEFGDIQKVLTLSKANSRKWRRVMERSRKAWYKVIKKGQGLSTKFRFEPVEAA
jgi:hypothetical protein